MQSGIHGTRPRHQGGGLIMEEVCPVDLFLKDVASHQMHIIQNDGVNRHIRFSKPGTSCYHFDLITWPGHLCYTGDMGTWGIAKYDQTQIMKQAA